MLCSTNIVLLLGALTSLAAAIPAPNPRAGLPLGFLNPFDERPRPKKPPPNMYRNREDFENMGTEDEASDDFTEEVSQGYPEPMQDAGSSWSDLSSIPGGGRESTRPMYYPIPASKINNGIAQPNQYTDADMQGDVDGTMEAKIFGVPLTHDQYYMRNYLWIRCRTSNTLNFDIGGSWAGPEGEYFKKALKKRQGRKCNLMNWHFNYVNGNGWGDAVMGAHWFEPWCSVSDAVDAAIDLSRTIAYFMRREFYIYNCPGYEQLTNYYNEPAEWDKYSKGKKPAFATAKGKGKKVGGG